MADADAIRNVARRIAATRDDGNQVVAVVSAMGDSTDHLIALARQVSDRPDPRELDVLQSTGELVSCALVAMALRSLGHDALSLSGGRAGIRTDTQHGRAKIAEVAPDLIATELDLGRIVIVAGFQGMSEDMDVTTLGRGASDLSAVALAAALRADRCEIYTDVEGIFTADPRLVPEARKLDEVGFEEMLEMASYGAKMDPRSIEMAMFYDVHIRVASSFTHGPGTLIHEEANMSNGVGEIRNRVRGVPTDTKVAKITVRGVPDRPGVQAEIFEPLADTGVSVDVIVQNPAVGGATDVTFTVPSADLPRALEVTEQAARQIGTGPVAGAGGLAKVSIVGTGMQDASGYASRMFRALADAGVNIEMITTSEIRITCVVDEERVGAAARALHLAFELDREE